MADAHNLTLQEKMFQELERYLREVGKLPEFNGWEIKATYAPKSHPNRTHIFLVFVTKNGNTLIQAQFSTHIDELRSFPERRFQQDVLIPRIRHTMEEAEKYAKDGREG